MKFRPLHDCVVIRRVGAEEKTAGGIIIPDTANGKADGRRGGRGRAGGAPEGRSGSTARRPGR